MSVANVEELIMRDEGMELKPYRCTAGRLTIGVGRNIEDVGISKDEALYLLNNDIGRCDHELTVAFRWYRDLSAARKAVLISMAFNLGFAGLYEFKRMLAYLAVGDYDRAANEMLLSQWAGQVGARAQRLSQMMKDDVFV